jgi:hypothetical protein
MLARVEKATALRPPVRLRPDGAARLVGVEIEIAGLGARAAAMLLRELRGGRMIELDPYRFDLVGTALGDVTVELDLRLAHPPREAPAGSPRRLLASAVGLAASRLAQIELIFAPWPPERLPELDRLVGELIGRAPGLRVDGPHLNPEVASFDPDYLLAHLRAFARLAPQLRAEMGIAEPRRFGTMTGFPPAYCRLLADPEYRPDLDRLADDYLHANPTRYRELDLLPLLMFVAPDRVRGHLLLQKIKPRPVFHWRMPGARLFAGVVADWNRWVAVERLAQARTPAEELLIG